jgi:hypothetical protein
MALARYVVASRVILTPAAAATEVAGKADTGGAPDFGNTTTGVAAGTCGPSGAMFLPTAAGAGTGAEQPACR